MKNSNTHKQKQLLYIAIAAVMLFVSQGQAAAQNQQRIYKPGDMIEMDGGEVYKIIRCNGEGEWDECEYQAYVNNKPSGNPNKLTIRNLRASEERLRLARERAGKSDGGGIGSTNNTNNNGNRNSSTQQTTVSPSPPKNKQTTGGGKVAGLNGKWKVGDKLEVNDRAFWYPAEIVAVQGGKYKVHFEGYPASDDKWVDDSRMRPIGGFQNLGECDYDLPGDVSAKASASEQLFKKKIWQRYFSLSQAGGNPSVNSSLETGITFLTFQMGVAFKNTVGNLPGQGTSRINNGAPVNAAIYPVKTKYVLCKKYKEGVSRSMYDEEMHCFKNKEGEWTCDGAGVPKITQID